MAKTYNIFISHAWDYNDEYYRLVNLLNSASRFDWKNYSVPEHDRLDGGRTLASQLENQIRPTSIVLVLAGMYVNHREWIQKEIKIAQAYGKPIIAISPWGAQVVPAELSSLATANVNWQTSSIVDAVRTHSI